MDAGDEEPINPFDERLWELYTIECTRWGARPSIKDYLIWCEERDG